MQKYFRILLVLFISAVFISCNEDEDDENQPAVESGTFSVSIAGAVNKEMEGDARFHHSIVETQASEGSQLQILLINEENQHEQISLTIMVRDDLEGVDPGSYHVNQSSSEEPFVTIYYTSEENMEYIATTSGTIHLAERTDDQVWGSFSGKLIEIQNRTVEISGDFNAEAN